MFCSDYDNKRKTTSIYINGGNIMGQSSYYIYAARDGLLSKKYDYAVGKVESPNPLSGGAALLLLLN